MKNALPFLLLLVCLIGCSKFGSNSSSTSNANSSNTTANTAPATPKQIVDLPATFGKSKDEIKKVVNATPKSEDPWLEYDLPEATLTFMFDKGKSNQSSFTFKSVRVGDASISGLQTAEQLATMAGIDIKGKSPTSTSSLADNYEQEIGGQKARIAIYKSNDKYNMIMISR